MLEAEASVRPSVSSMTCAEMCRSQQAASPVPRVSDTLALVRLGLADLADVRRNFAHPLLVDAED
jgi:hypothetical protein